MRDFACRHNLVIYDVGEGISHVVLPEKGHVVPGRLIVGSDSHTVTYGALNCVGLGLGATDVAVAMATGKVWLRIPKTIRIHLTANLNKGCTSKDLALELIRRLSVEGANYKCVEFTGEGVSTLSIEERFTVCNMMVKLGAKCTLMPCDNLTTAYLEHVNVHAFSGFVSDSAAIFDQEIEVNLSSVEPLIAVPHGLTNITTVKSVAGKPITQAFLGSCTNGRLSDLYDAAEQLRGHMVAPGVRFIVTPGSRSVYKEALKAGLIETLMEAGCMIMTPGCGACIGTHGGIP